MKIMMNNYEEERDCLLDEIKNKELKDEINSRREETIAQFSDFLIIY